MQVERSTPAVRALRRASSIVPGIALVAAAAAVLLQSSAVAQPAPPRITDRTLSCSTAAIGGLRKIEVRAYAGVRASGAWRKLPFAIVVTPTALDFTSTVLWISAAHPSATTTMGQEEWTLPPLEHGTLAVSQEFCRTVDADVRLASDGLQGGRVGQLGEGFMCAAPRRVLVRVRAVFGSPTRLRARTGYSRTTAPIVEAAFAVRSQSGKAIVYATTAAPGTTRLFTARGCFPD